MHLLLAMGGLFRFLVGTAVVLLLASPALPRPEGIPPADDAKVSAPAPALSQADLIALEEDELRSRIESDPESLGTLSIGTPSGGILLNGVLMPAGPGWEIVLPAESLGTEETISFIQTAIARVEEIYPGSPPLSIGDISHSTGGRLNRHVSHQAGRDVDLGFYYKKGRGQWYTPGTSANLDLPRNWALVRALLACTDVEKILLDIKIQSLLYNYALSIGEDKAWLNRVFKFVKGAGEARICHVRGHRTHYHIRFYNPLAQELGRRAYPHLIRLGKIKPPVFTVRHTVREGETLGQVARRYGVSVRAIQQCNGLSSTLIRAGRSYRIPVKGTVKPPAGPLIFPVRLLPPRTPLTLAAFKWPSPIEMYGQLLRRLAGSPIFAVRPVIP